MLRHIKTRAQAKIGQFHVTARQSARTWGGGRGRGRGAWVTAYPFLSSKMLSGLMSLRNLSTTTTTVSNNLPMYVMQFVYRIKC
jgi:hypothetical protein